MRMEDTGTHQHQLQEGAGNSALEEKENEEKAATKPDQDGFSEQQDFTYGGFGSRWLAMRAIANAKFRPDSEMALKILSTGDDFLLEYPSASLVDAINSSELNWSGLQLMLVRDALNGKSSSVHSWSRYIFEHVDEQTGAARTSVWKEVVQNASDAVSMALGAACSSQEQRLTQGQAMSPTMSDAMDEPSDVIAPFWKIADMKPVTCIITWILVLATFACTTIAILAKLYVYEWSGVVGAFKLITNDAVHAEYSVMDILWGLLEPFTDAIGSRVLGYFLFVVASFFLVIAPTLYVVLLFVVWALPLSPKRQYQFFVWGQIVNAWAAMDVFVISVFVSMFGGESFGITSFVTFMIEHGNAEPLCDTLKERLGIQCVGFSPQPLWGCYLLLIASLLQFITGRIVYRAWYQVVKCSDSS